MFKKILLLLACTAISLVLKAQDNYEIQVYGSETVAKDSTMIELHSNYTISGTKTVSEDGELPTNHVDHETIEITHGWTPWFETGFYFFNSIGSEGRTAYVGSHLRPRVMAPASWKWPVGVSLSTEFGFQKKQFSANTATLEVRPIIDKTWDKWYVSLNPTVDKSFAGPDEHKGFIFSPNVKADYNITKAVALGLEYYGTTGPFFHYDSISEQDHQLFIVTDLNVDPRWEFNAGFGYGLTQTSDRAIVKMIIGRRF